MPKLGETVPVEERFWSKVDMTGECWVWTASLSRYGYGKFNAPGSPTRKVTAHRMAWMLTYGDIPPGAVVRHRCDNPKCVRPEHLDIGTPADNTADMVQRGRHKNQRKTHCPLGHEYDLVNTKWDSKGHRHCRECMRRTKRNAYWSDPERYRAESATRSRIRRKANR